MNLKYNILAYQGKANKEEMERITRWVCIFVFRTIELTSGKENILEKLEA
jgi:hypothetical protein